MSMSPKIGMYVWRGGKGGKCFIKEGERKQSSEKEEEEESKQGSDSP